MKQFLSEVVVFACTKVFLALAGCLLLAGCIIIPTDYHAAGSRHNVTTAITNTLRIGQTTRTELLLALGEPDFVSEDGRRFGYHWSKVKAICVVASYGGSGDVAELTRSYLIETSFDASNRVSLVRVKKQWGDVVRGDGNGDGDGKENTLDQ